MEIKTNVDEQEKLILDIAKGNTKLEVLTFWLKKYITTA